MKRKPGIGMVERAVIAQKWRKSAVDANIHAMIGDNSDAMVNLSGRMFFVALGAAMLENISANDPDVSILRGAVNAVHDQAGEDDILPDRRMSIVSGLQAVARIVERVPHHSIAASACDLEVKLRTQDLHYTDFLRLVA